jgi:hypothetical protein
MASASKTRRTHPVNTGIICAGYLLKERDGMVRAGWAERYVVLSSDYLHYFRRTDSKSEIFGEERDKIPVGTVERVLVKRTTAEEGSYLFVEVHTARRGYPIVLTAKNDKVTLEWAQGIDFVSKVAKGISPHEQGGPFNDLYIDSSGSSRSIITPTPLLLSKSMGPDRDENVSEVIIQTRPRWGGKFILKITEEETVKLLLSDASIAAFTMKDMPHKIGAVASLHVEAMFRSSDETRSRTRTNSFVVSGQDMSLLSSAVMMKCQLLSSCEETDLQRTNSPNVSNQKEGYTRPGRVQSTICLLLWLYITSYFYMHLKAQDTQELLVLQSVISIISIHFLHTWFSAFSTFRSPKSDANQLDGPHQQQARKMGLSTFEVLLERWVPPEGMDAVIGVDVDSVSSLGSRRGSVEMPKRFLYAEKGDAVRAMERYKATLKFRQDGKIDTILQEVQPHFYNIKECYPHWYITRWPFFQLSPTNQNFNLLCAILDRFNGKSKKGYAVYFEQPGKINLSELKKRGIHNAELLRHFLFSTEVLAHYSDANTCSTERYLLSHTLFTLSTCGTTYAQGMKIVVFPSLM